MKEQVNEGHVVGLLWPGQISMVSYKTKIKQHPNIDGIKSWEIINPTPVSYDEGIQKIENFMKAGDYNCYMDFLRKQSPEVIHVHTLMGIHKNFLEAAHDLKIRMVFTAHDFFPICPKVTLFHDGNVCTDAIEYNSCPQCNSTALPIWKIILLQSRAYRMTKNNKYVKKLRKNHRDNYLSGKNKNTESVNSIVMVSDYKVLRDYYASLLDYMDCIHYNSSITKNIYEKYFGQHLGVILPITHADIQDNRKKKKFSSQQLRITYLGTMSEAKGFFLLKSALDELWKIRQDFCLNIFFQMEKKPPYIKSFEHYEYSELSNIFENTDILVAPSVWYETFGFTVLEALSYGVPVLITKHVGAKDIIPEYAGLVVDEINTKGLLEAITGITKEKLDSMNQSILKDMKIMTIQDMSADILKYCYLEGFNEAN
jgi:glycosyltransferase involved in cell wall biosynthesis